MEGKRFADYLRFKQSQGVRLQPKTHALYCKACKSFHPYNGPMKLEVEYEKRGEAWILMWLCPITGDHVGEIWLGDRRGKDDQDSK